MPFAKAGSLVLPIKSRIIIRMTMHSVVPRLKNRNRSGIEGLIRGIGRVLLDT